MGEDKIMKKKVIKKPIKKAVKPVKKAIKPKKDSRKFKVTPISDAVDAVVEYKDGEIVSITPEIAEKAEKKEEQYEVIGYHEISGKKHLRDRITGNTFFED